MKRLLFITLALIIAAQAWAQNEDKFGPSTELFLQEMKQPRPFAPPRKMPRMKGVKPQGPEDYRVTPRMVSAPDTINGQVYMSAYLRVADSHNTGDVEALGVIIESRFSKGLTIALIPVDKIQEVAALPSVKHINAAAPKRKKTDMARQYTNTDDVLKHSADAITAGLGTAYDGTGVLLGVIDTGIDFNHIAFKDKNGTSRIAKAYVHNGSSETEYNGSSIPSNLTDDNTEDHGTHTATTAGGSSVITTNTSVTVTDDHSAATYGGMAPGATLYLAGINGLNDTGLDNAVKKMVQYAEANNMPLVVSNSWGSGIGPRDGTGDTADVYADLFGDDHPNRVALFAASNDAGNGAKENGGYHVRGTASSSSPLGTILRSSYYSDTDNGYLYDGLLAVAWTRASSSYALRCKIHVLNSSTGAILWSSNEISPTSSGSTVSGFSTYYSGTITVQNISSYYNAKGKKGLRVYVSSDDAVKTKSATNYNSKYTLAIEVYPSSGSATIDMWGGDYSYFSNKLSTSGHTWVNGSDDMCVSDEATISDVISIGAYVSKRQWTNYNDDGYSSSSYTLNDIAPFSSYATAAESPTGIRYPWICAPGARLCAGVNHNHTSDSYSYYHSDNVSDLIVNHSTNPYGLMQGTSMATPTAAGIVALWMQVAKENDIELTHSMIKEAMMNSAITDSYTTTGANASHFGNGKLDALAGIKYILDNYASTDPVINVAPTEVNFGEVVTDSTTTQNLRVSGRNLTGDVTLSLSAPNGGYTLSQTSITAANAANGVDVTLTFAPTVLQSYPATLTLASGPTTQTVTITGTGALLKEVPVLNNIPSSYIGTTSFTASWSSVPNVQSYTLQVNAKSADSNTFALVTDASTLKAGDKVIIVESGKAMTTTNSGTYYGETAVTVSNNQVDITGVDGVNVLTLEDNAGAWKLKQANGQYLLSSAAKTLKPDAEGTQVSISIASNAASIDFGTAGLLLHNINNTRFTTYTSTPNSNQVRPQLYKMTSGSASSPRKAIIDTGDADTGTRTISGITGTSHTVDNLTSGGKYTYKVKAVYTDNSEGEWSAAKDVTLASGPTIIAIDDELSVSATVGESGTATLGILCEVLEAGVTATLGGTNANLFTITPASVTKAEAEEGAEFTITYTPTAAGTHTATVTLTSTNAESVVVPITGTATAAAIGKPEATPATAVTASGFTANWKPLTGADGYELHVYTQTSGTSSSGTIASNFTNQQMAVDDGELTWSTSETATGFEDSSSTYNRGVAWGSGTSTNLTATISDATAITKVTVKASTNGSSSSLAVSVNGTSYGSQNVTSGTGAANTDYTFTGNASGPISVAMTNSKTFWIKSITVEYTTGGGEAQTTEITDSPFTISGGNTTSYPVTGLEAETTYYYYVYGKQGGTVATEQSNIIDVTTLASGTTPTPELVVVNPTPATLTFSDVTAGSTATQTFEILGSDLTGAVSVSVSGDNVFSVSPASISIADAEEGATVIVTYAPTAAGTHSGTVTVASDGAQNVTVALNGTAVAGGGGETTSNVYEKVTSANALVSGRKVLIVYESGSKALAAITSGTGGGEASVTISSNEITLDSNSTARPLTITGSTSAGWSFYDETGNYYMALTSDGNTLHTSSSSAIWSATYSSGTLTLSPSSYSSRKLRYNTQVTNGTPFRCYTSGQQAVAIYQQKVASTAPTITASPTSVTIDQTNVGSTNTGTFTVTGANLTGDVNVAVTGSDYLTVSPTTITAADAANGATVTITYAPTATGNHNGTVTLTSEGATDVTVSVTAAAVMPVSDPVLLTATEDQIGTTQFTASWNDSTDDAYVDSYTLYINKKAETPTPTYELLSTGDFSNGCPPGWTAVTGQGTTSFYIGSKKNLGSVSSPEVDFTGYSKATVILTAKKYDSCSAKVTVGNCTSQTTATLSDSYADYALVFDISGESDLTSLETVVETTDKQKRFYISKIRIYGGDASEVLTASSAPRLKAVSDNGNADDEGRTISGITAKSHTVDQLTAGSTYIYKVKAVYINGEESQWTKEKEVTLKPAATLGEAVGTSVINLPVNIAYVDEKNGIAYGCASAGENQITEGNASVKSPDAGTNSDDFDKYDQRDWVAIEGLKFDELGLSKLSDLIGKTISGFEGKQDTDKPGYYFKVTTQPKPTSVIAQNQSGDNNVPANEYQVHNLVASTDGNEYVRPQVYEYTKTFYAALKKENDTWKAFGISAGKVVSILLDTSLMTLTDAHVTADNKYSTLAGVFVAVADASHAPLRSGSADLSTQSYKFLITEVIEDVATGIETLKADGVEYKLRGIYNLQGQRVRETVPGQFYIINGEKRRVGHVIRDNDF